MAILIEKLKIFDDEIEKRNVVAQRYNEAFAASNRIVVPRVIGGVTSAWAQNTLQVESWAKFQADLQATGVPMAVYYPIALSKQKACAHYPSAPTSVSEAFSARVVSLPMHSYMGEATQDHVIAAVLESVAT